MKRWRLSLFDFYFQYPKDRIGKLCFHEGKLPQCMTLCLMGVSHALLILGSVAPKPSVDSHKGGDSIKIGQVKLSLTSVEGIIKQMTKGDQFNGKQESKAVQ